MKKKVDLKNTMDSENFRSEIFFFNLTLLLFIFRTAVPLFKYAFLLLLLGNLFYYAIFYRKIIIPGLKKFSRNFLLIITIVGIQILAFLLSDKLYLIIFKEISNSLILLFLFFMLSLSVNSIPKLEKYLDDFINLIILFGFVISVFGILDVFSIFSINATRDIDYNFALLPIFFSIIAIIYKQTRIRTFRKNIIFNIFSVAYILQIMFSGSRRGIIMGLLIALILILTQFYYLLNRKKLQGSTIGRVSSGSAFLSFSLIVIPLVFYFLVFNLSYTFKENFLNIIGTKNKSDAKYKICFSVFRYGTILGNRFDFPQLYQKMWTPPFNSNDPTSWWKSKSGACRTISPLTGPNVKIVPDGTTGVIIDSNWVIAEKNGLICSNDLIEHLNIKKGEIVEASVYCYVTKDFKGSSINISFSGAVEGDKVSNVYDLDQSHGVKGSKDLNLLENGDFKKGTLNWIPNASSTDHQIINTPFGKGIRVTRTLGMDDWSLQYHGKTIIFHMGHEYMFHFYYKVIKGNTIPFYIGWWLDDAGQGFGTTVNLPLQIKDLQDGWKEVKCSYVFKETHLTGDYIFLNSFQSNTIADFADIRLFDIDADESLPAFGEGGRELWQQLRVKAVGTGGKINLSLSITSEKGDKLNPIQGYVIFAYPEFRIIDRKILPVSESNNISEINTAGLLRFRFNRSDYQDTSDRDLIRRFTSRLISQDTTYHGYTSELSVDTISNSFIDLRLRRWQFALQIYFKEYRFVRKMIGGGYNHLNWFAYYFEKDKSIIDYPHNPVLSVLLYSGIIGVFLYLFLFFRTIRYYYLYFEKYYILALFFILAFFFSFFSAGNPLDPPVTGFLIIMATFIHNIYRKQQNS